MRHHRAFLAVLAASAVLNLVGLTWGLPSPVGWAADELTPVRVLEGMRERFAGGWHDPYPPFHFYVLAAAYAPVLAVDASPLGDITSSETGWRRRRGDGAFFALFLAGRAVSALMALGLVLLVYRCGLELFDRPAATWAALVAALSLPVVYYAKIANVDLPFAFWFSLAFWAYLRILREHRIRDYALFGAAAALAVAAKDQAFALFLLPAVHVVLAARGRPGAARGLLTALGAGAGTFLFATGIVFNPTGYAAHLAVATGPMNRALQMFPRTPGGFLAMLGLTARLVVFCLGLPGACACASGLALLAWRQPGPMTPILLPALSYLLFFLLVALVGYDRYLMPVVVCLSLPAGYFLARGRRLFRLGFAAAVVAWGLARLLAVDLAMSGDARYTAERWMAANLPPGAAVGVSGPLTHLPRLYGYDWTQRATLPALRAVRPPFAVVTADRARGSMALEEDASALGYEIAFRHRTARPWPLDLGWWIHGLERHTNLHKIDPEVAVLRRPAG